MRRRVGDVAECGVCVPCAAPGLSSRCAENGVVDGDWDWPPEGDESPECGTARDAPRWDECSSVAVRTSWKGAAAVPPSTSVVPLPGAEVAKPPARNFAMSSASDTSG